MNADKSRKRNRKHADPTALDQWSGELYNKPGHLIRRCYQIVIALYIEEARGLGLTQLQYVTLRVISHYPGESQRGLGALAAVDRTTIGWVITTLEQKGFLRREADSRDRRQQCLKLTPLGQRKLKNVDARMQRLQARILQPLAPAERQTFIGYLQKIVLAHNEYSRAPLRANATVTTAPKLPAR